MIIYNFTKDVLGDKLQSEIFNAGLTTVQYINTNGNFVEVYFSSELDTSQQSILSSIVNSHIKTSIEDSIRTVVINAIYFGNSLMTTFATENILMGITQDGMTNTVRKNLSEVISALITGSLYDAIHEVKVLPADKKDPKYLTDSRLLYFINKIETYLGIPLSTSL